MPLNVGNFERLLLASEYNLDKTEFLLDGFKNGFDIEYQGPTKRQSTSQNIPFTVGNKYILWEKILKEVELG